MEKIHLYFVPGLAANSKIFENLKFPNHYELHFLEWIDPFKNEPISNYAKRMCSFVVENNPILIGVSFGGIMVQEMKKHISTRKIIIISSIKSKHELSLLSKFAKFTKLYSVIPFIINNALEPSLKVVFRKKSAERIRLYNMYLSKRNALYLNWSLKNVLYWNRENVDEEVVHIHGNKDEIFPIKYLKNCIVVEQGTHIMIINKAKTISNLIQKEINKYED